MIKKPSHIVAIGASAGGIEELNLFFDHTPSDGISYVIVQHLSSAFKSNLARLLGRHSKLLVKEAEHGMLVKGNEVYIIPNNKEMTIRENRLYLSAKDDTKKPHLTINIFLKSLAADRQATAIAVILSGLGADGTEGARAIKNAGGFVIARDPATSEFGSMPSHAIAQGVVDVITEPEYMPATIDDYIQNGIEILTEEEDEDKTINAIIDLINEKLPIDFAGYKQGTLSRRIRRRATMSNFKNLQNYLEYLQETPLELQQLAADFLISVTSFFRDKEAFEFLETDIIPSLIERLTKGEELKLWVAGCATGEEAYSLAILTTEQMQAAGKNNPVKIFATDIDAMALVHAGKGIYGSHIEKNIPAERLEKYFIKQDNTYRVRPQIRKMLIFALHDLVKNPPYCNMHLISCRNLLIYMTPALQKKIFSMLLFGLKLNGYLFLGSSENPVPIMQNLDVINKKWKIYKNLETKKTVHFEGYSMPQMIELKKNGFLPAHRNTTRVKSAALDEAITDAALSELDCLMVCIDEDDCVLKNYGNTSKYLLPKVFNKTLTDLLPRPLLTAFTALSIQVRKTNTKASMTGITLNTGPVPVFVSVLVMPLYLPDEKKEVLIVIFSEDKQTAPTAKEAEKATEILSPQQYTLILEEELQELKNKLTATYDQLDASNDNMQSYNEELLSANEELQSANEEMQSTNEEMQSVNEELHTINADYILKNKELLELNDDLDNYFRNNINGQLFIDENLQLKKYSPNATQLFNLLPGDIGRPLSNITTSIKSENIISNLIKVINGGNAIIKEVETHNGQWYQLVTTPYISQSQLKHTGAIITFTDITGVKNTRKQLDAATKMLALAVDTAGLGTWSININTREFVASARLKEIFGFYPGQEVSYEAALARIDPKFADTVKAQVNRSIKYKEKFDAEYLIHTAHKNESRWVRSVGNISPENSEGPELLTGILIDITLHKENEIR